MYAFALIAFIGLVFRSGKTSKSVSYFFLSSSSSSYIEITLLANRHAPVLSQTHIFHEDGDFFTPLITVICLYSQRVGMGVDLSPFYS